MHQYKFARFVSLLTGKLEMKQKAGYRETSKLKLQA